MEHLSERRTEDVVVDLLHIQGWPTQRPSKGRVIRQNEYKAFPHLIEIFKGRSKTGKGDAYPDFMLLSSDFQHPVIVIETKSGEGELDAAAAEACDTYGEACVQAGHSVIAIGVAGQEKTGIRVRALKIVGGKWKEIQHNGKAISWIPTPADVEALLACPGKIDLAPVVPQPEVLAEKADTINRLLRESHVKDEYRPAYVGAMMLALWQSRGRLRREASWILKDINLACKTAFEVAEKAELAESLYVDEANGMLSETAWQILAILENLNVVSASFSHDYLGQLYETFFRYTGGNTIGQYFTPRHITRFMADLCEVTKDDIVIDPACGTGGFLISCLQRVQEITGCKYEDVVNMVRYNLIGYESEPVTAALCVTNMILRGDGKTGVRKAECLSASGYPEGKCDVALMNPPFPHKKTDIPPQRFVERALEALKKRGRLAVILPTSMVVKKNLGPWREKILKDHTLLAVAQLPDELFQPFASATTSVVVLQKGVPHSSDRKTVFLRIQYDGLTLKKGARVPREDGKNQLKEAVAAFLNKSAKSGFSGVANVSGREEWSPGAYIPAAIPTADELKQSIDELMRRAASFYIRYAAEIVEMQKSVSDGDLIPKDYRTILGKQRLDNSADLPRDRGTIGSLFDLYYGQKELHSRDGIPPGNALIVSPTEEYNGCYGWLEFDNLIKPSFVTVAQTGSIGEAFVQREPCGVNDDCLILLPRKNMKVPLACLFIAAAIVRLERWRFSYGRKLTPARICSFRMRRVATLEAWVDAKIKVWDRVVRAALDDYR